MPINFTDDLFEDEITIAIFSANSRENVNIPRLTGASMLALTSAWASGKLNAAANATGEALTFIINSLSAFTRLAPGLGLAILFIILAWWARPVAATTPAG
jgi:hypothetical protein